MVCIHVVFSSLLKMLHVCKCTHQRHNFRLSIFPKVQTYAARARGQTTNITGASLDLISPYKFSWAWDISCAVRCCVVFTNRSDSSSFWSTLRCWTVLERCENIHLTSQKKHRDCSWQVFSHLHLNNPHFWYPGVLIVTQTRSHFKWFTCAPCCKNTLLDSLHSGKKQLTKTSSGIKNPRCNSFFLFLFSSINRTTSGYFLCFVFTNSSLTTDVLSFYFTLSYIFQIYTLAEIIVLLWLLIYSNKA